MNAKHQAIFNRLKTEILSGKFSGSASKFPSERALAHRFDVSRNTITLALQELRGRGFLVRQQGSGTFLTGRAKRLSGSVGLIIPGVSYSEVFPVICRELVQLVQKSGMTLLLGDITSKDSKKRARMAMKLAERFVSDNVSGVIFQPLEFLEDAEEINRQVLEVFDRAKIPVVLIDNDIVPSPQRSRYEVVSVNSFDIGRRMAAHLVEAGAKGVCFLVQPNSAKCIQDRVAGARSVLAEKGLPLLVVDVDVKNAASVGKLLRKRPRQNAIVCRNDHIAAYLLQTLRRLGKHVPEDVMVVGCNDADYAAALEPSLTTIRIPCKGIAATAFRLLVERIGNPALLPRECYLDAPLVVRKSTASERGSKA